MSKSAAYCLFVNFSVVAVACPLSARAQESPPAANAEASPGLEEIIVTAQRRDENQQRVPIAITAVTGTDLTTRGISGTEDLGNTVPSLQFSRQTGNGGTPFIRGVGSTQAVVGTEASVAVYIDDVYISSPNATLMQFNNVTEVEVEKGPQGTLFGRNATGGVINIHTAAPSQTNSFDVVAGEGSYNTQYGSLYANAGLNDTMSANIAVTGSNQHDGYGRSLVTGQEIYKEWDFGVRGRFKWTPSSTTTVLLAADYSEDHGDAGMNVVIAPGTVALGGATYKGPFSSYDYPLDFTTNIVDGFSAEVTQDLGFADLVSVSSFRQTFQTLALDVDGSLPGNPYIVQAVVPATTKNASQELRLASTADGPLHWQFGGFYYFAKSQYKGSYLYGEAFEAIGGQENTAATQTVNSYSGFGEASYNILPATKLTLGARYTTDDYGFTAVYEDADRVPLPPGEAHASQSFSKFTYRAILDQQITQDVLAYGSYSVGFHSGGYPLSAAFIPGANGATTLAPPVAPETLDAYEVGVKSEWLNHTVRLNAAAFLYNYNDMQVTTIGQATSVTLNAAKARIKGLDADLTIIPFKNLELVVGAAYLDSKFLQFDNAPFFVPSPANCATLQTTGPLAGGNSSCPANLAGYRTPLAPVFAGNVSATYTLPTVWGDFSGNLSLYHSAKYYWAVDDRYAQPTQDLVSTSISWKSVDGKWGLRFYGRNLLNRYYYSYFSESSTRDSGTPAMPRNFGGEVQFHF